MADHTRPLSVKSAALAVVLFCVTHSVWAGIFSVSPVRIFMTPRDRAVAITVHNEAETPLLLQAELYRWEQDANGVDRLSDTDELIMAPPVLRLAGQSKQAVRMAMLSPPDMTRQASYRLLLKEVRPPQAAPEAGLQVPISLVISLPAFITPPNAARKMSCELSYLALPPSPPQAAPAQASASGAQAPANPPQAVPIDTVLRCSNSGNAYAQIRKASVLREGAIAADFEGGVYILPGATRVMRLAAVESLGTGQVQLQVEFDDGKTETFSATVTRP